MTTRLAIFRTIRLAIFRPLLVRLAFLREKLERLNPTRDTGPTIKHNEPYDEDGHYMRLEELSRFRYGIIVERRGRPGEYV